MLTGTGALPCVSTLASTLTGSAVTVSTPSQRDGRSTQLESTWLLFDEKWLRLWVAYAPAPILVPVVDAKSRPTIRRGDHGVAVKLLQKALKLDVDGIFGGKTEAAVRAWQRKRDIVPDGIVGPRTWASLEGSL